MCDQHVSANESTRRVSSPTSQDSVNFIVTSSQTEQTSPAVSSTGSLRKSYSYVETLVRERKMNDCPPKKKYLKRFEKIFWPIIGEETLYSCYSCALYQDSIASGHLYLTFGWFCFYSNFIGRQRQVAINVSKILSITQERTAKIIPNAIKITTDTESYVFSSFMSRDRAYKTLVRMWHKSEELALSCEESDLSDVDSMTQIVAISGYADIATNSQARSEFEDSTSDLSLPGNENESGQTRDHSSTAMEVTAVVENGDHLETDPEGTTPNRTPIMDPLVVNKLECKQWRPWDKAEAVLVSLQNLVKWCCFHSSAVLGDAHTFYNVLIICTALLAIMTFYLGMRMFLFEQQQISTLVRKQLRLHDSDMQFKVDETLQFNHKVLTEISHLLSDIRKLVLDTGRSCCHHLAQ